MKFYESYHERMSEWYDNKNRLNKHDSILLTFHNLLIVKRFKIFLTTHISRKIRKPRVWVTLQLFGKRRKNKRVAKLATASKWCKQCDWLKVILRFYQWSTEWNFIIAGGVSAKKENFGKIKLNSKFPWLFCQDETVLHTRWVMKSGLFLYYYFLIVSIFSISCGIILFYQILQKVSEN